MRQVQPGKGKGDWPKATQVAARLGTQGSQALCAGPGKGFGLVSIYYRVDCLLEPVYEDKSTQGKSSDTQRKHSTSMDADVMCICLEAIHNHAQVGIRKPWRLSHPESPHTPPLLLGNWNGGQICHLTPCRQRKQSSDEKREGEQPPKGSDSYQAG